MTTWCFNLTTYRYLRCLSNSFSRSDPNSGGLGDLDDLERVVWSPWPCCRCRLNDERFSDISVLATSMSETISDTDTSLPPRKTQWNRLTTCAILIEVVSSIINWPPVPHYAIHLCTYTYICLFWTKWGLLSNTESGMETKVVLNTHHNKRNEEMHSGREIPRTKHLQEGWRR